MTVKLHFGVHHIGKTIIMKGGFQSLSTERWHHHQRLHDDALKICGDGGAEPVDNALVDEYPLWISTDRGEIHDGSHCQGYQCKLPMDDGEQLARRDQE